jgi:hypothetical protein
MNTKHTPQQTAEFAEFCQRHALRFNTLREYRAALAQYFLE